MGESTVASVCHRIRSALLSGHRAGTGVGEYYMRAATLKAKGVNVTLSNRVSDVSSGYTLCFELGGTVQWEKAQWPVCVCHRIRSALLSGPRAGTGVGKNYCLCCQCMHCQTKSDVSSGYTLCFELGGNVQWEEAQWPVCMCHRIRSALLS